MMSFPAQCSRTYINPIGNVVASGYYRSSKTQEVANMLPPWMFIRDEKSSIGQQFISAPAMELKKLEAQLNDSIKNKFLTTAKVDDIDVLYRVKIPSNINLTDSSGPSLKCIAAPSGYSVTSANSITLTEVSNLKEFYYDVLPTRLEVVSSGFYQPTVDGIPWHISPSGVYDKEEKHVDVWGKTHDISWAATKGTTVNEFRKQDVETLEDYEVYSTFASGIITDMDYYRGMLWSIERDPIDQYTVLLLHGNGEDGTSNIIDECGHQIIASGVTHDTSQPGIGVSSLSVNDTVATNGISVIYDGDFDFGSDEFTIETRIMFKNDDSTNKRFLAQGYTSGNYIRFNDTGNKLGFEISPVVSVQTPVNAWVKSLNTWYNIAIVRDNLASPWGVAYTPENYTPSATPFQPWTPVINGAASWVREVDSECSDGYRMVQNSSSTAGIECNYEHSSPSYFYYNCDSSLGYVVSARLKVLSSGAGSACNIIILDGKKSIPLFFLDDKITIPVGYLVSGDATYTMDTTDSYHVYEIVVKDTLLKIYVDNVLRITGTLNSATTATYIAWGDWFQTAGYGGVVYWDYIAYKTDNDTRIYTPIMENGTKDGKNLKCKIFIDGKLQYLNGNYGFENKSVPVIPSNILINWFDGWIQEYRISKGIARWRSDYDIPVSQYNTPKITLNSTKTQVPNSTTLDLLAEYKIDSFPINNPSGILIDEVGSLRISNDGKCGNYEVKPRYDYFIVDKDNRYVYMREDYRDSGVFISNI